MFKIKGVFRYILIILSFVFFISAVFTASFSKPPIERKSDYTVADRWEISPFRHIDLSLLEGKEDLLLSYKLSSCADILSFKSRGYNVTAFVSGKILYQNYSPEGERYHFIPIDSLKAGSVIMLRLIPCSKGGKILTSAVISTRSGLIQKLIYENRRRLIFSFLFFSASLYFLFKIKKKRSRLRGANLFLILFSLGALTLLNSNLSFVFFKYNILLTLKILGLLSLFFSVFSLLCNAFYKGVKLVLANSDNVV